MTHSIEENKKYSVVSVKLAVNATDPNDLADSLNETFREHIGEGVIADYALLNTEEPVVVMSSSEPKEGELFDQAQAYLLHVEGSDYSEEWKKIETTSDLESMSATQLKDFLCGKLVIGGDDRISITRLEDVGRIVL